MVLFNFGALALAVSAVIGRVAAVADADNFVGPPLSYDLFSRQQRTIVTQYWANEYAKLNWTSGSAGKFAVTWNQPNGGNFVVGKGFRPGGNMIFNYSGNFTVNNRAYLCLYGWTTNPLTEWYVIENMGIHNPADNGNATCHGRIETSSGTYEVWSKWRINAPSIIGDATFQQYWSIRTKRRVGGTINTTEHLDAFRRAKLPLGRFEPVILAIEGQVGNGAATLTAGVAPTTPVPETTTSTRRTELVPSRACTARL